MRRSNRIALSTSILSALILFTAVPVSSADEEDAPRIRRPSIGDGVLSLNVSGEDPASPRALELWRWDGREFLRIAETRSEPSGHFDFGMHPIGIGTYYDVVVRGDQPSTHRMVAVEGTIPAPQVTSSEGIGGSEILIHPVRHSGEISVYDAETGRLRIRFPIEPQDRSPQLLDLDAELGRPLPQAVLIRHRLEDGRRSPASFWRLDQSDPSD